MMAIGGGLAQRLADVSLTGARKRRRRIASWKYAWLKGLRIAHHQHWLTILPPEIFLSLIDHVRTRHAANTIFFLERIVIGNKP